MSRTLGIFARRPLPHYARQRFDEWFAQCAVAGVGDPGRDKTRSHARAAGRADPGCKRRGRVILWDDTFVRYHEPHIGIAAVTVLASLGFEVSLLKNRKCCGRPAFSQGNLDEAQRLGEHNLALLCADDPAVPVVFLEPSCYSMFVEDYRELI